MEKSLPIWYFRSWSKIYVICNFVFFNISKQVLKDTRPKLSFKVLVLPCSIYSEHLQVSPSTSENLRESCSISKCLQASLWISKHLRAFLSVSECLQISLSIYWHLQASQSISEHPKASLKWSGTVLQMLSNNHQCSVMVKKYSLNSQKCSRKVKLSIPHIVDPISNII